VGLDGAGLSAWWGLPFVGMLLSIAVLPILAPRFWHKRMGLVSLIWSLALLIPVAVVSGIGVALFTVWHAAWVEFLPFVLLLLALFACGGGILVRGGFSGTPAGNTAALIIGTAFAGVMGTTGAAMVMIHPLLRANAHRTRKLHIVIFFIVLVANIGGATSPLGDPPLYIGFLNGVPFFWPLQSLLKPMLLVTIPLLAIFYAMDRYFAAKEPPPAPPGKLQLRGTFNIGLLLIVVLTVLVQGIWQPGNANLLGQEIGIERLVAMAIFVAVTLVSVAFTPRVVREGNDFNWHPMEEVGKLFAALFLTIGPVMAMLDAGMNGPMAFLLKLTQNANGELNPLAIFWLGGMLSAFLDNAPTYLVFFHLAGGDANELCGPLNPVLTAIAAGAVFFGALTYIGNAPNMMIRSIASRGQDAQLLRLFRVGQRIAAADFRAAEFLLYAVTATIVVYPPPRSQKPCPI
jgi:Na+/H+ antiporter NhaD/arsenite permease-like protein